MLVPNAIILLVRKLLADQTKPYYSVENKIQKTFWLYLILNYIKNKILILFLYCVIKKIIKKTFGF